MLFSSAPEGGIQQSEPSQPAALHRGQVTAWRGLSTSPPQIRSVNFRRYGTGSPAAPVEDLETLLLSQLPGVCNRCLALWRILAQAAPHKITGARCAQSLGYRNRYQFLRWLGRHGYPTFLELSDWTRLIAWLHETSRASTPLTRQAWATGVEPSVCYRTVRRLTGLTWESVRIQGLPWWVQRFRVQVGQAVRCRIQAAAHPKEGDSAQALLNASARLFDGGAQSASPKSHPNTLQDFQHLVVAIHREGGGLRSAAVRPSPALLALD